MIEIPVALLVAQWLLLLGLGLMVFLMYRQLAYLLGLSRAVSGSGGLDVGDKAPSFDYVPASTNGGDGELRRFAPEGTRTLLMFTTPGCATCQTALRSLEEATRRIRGEGLRVLVVTDAEPESVYAVEEFRESLLPVVRVRHDVATRLFRTYTTPFLYAIGDDGKVRGAREAVTAGQVKELVRKLRDH
jgi:peroxiredoxin